MKGETGLTRTPRTSQGHQPVGHHQFGHLIELTAAANEAGQLTREIVGTGIHRPDLRESVGQTGYLQLKHPDRMLEVFESVLAQIL